MDLNTIRLSLMRDKNQVGLQIIDKIESTAAEYSITINKAITYWLSNMKTPYQKRILAICRAVYPYDGQLQFRSMIDNDPVSYSNIDTIYYKVGKHTDDITRGLHEEDSNINEFPIGVEENIIYNTTNLKHNNNEMQAEIINPLQLNTNKQQTQKKPKRKRKKRID